MGEKKVILISFIVLIVVILVGLTLQNQTTQPEFKFSEPGEVVNQYFESWDKMDLPNMYAAISDGFKKIEPTATTLSDFRQYVESQGIEEIKMLSIEEKSNDGKTAAVEYSVELVLSNNTNKSSGEFILKFREGDLIRGWKLIHPYGQNIDTA